jgi:hypothetical protein
LFCVRSSRFPVRASRTSTNDPPALRAEAERLSSLVDAAPPAPDVIPLRLCAAV